MQGDRGMGESTEADIASPDAEVANQVCEYLESHGVPAYSIHGKLLQRVCGLLLYKSSSVWTPWALYRRDAARRLGAFAPRWVRRGVGSDCASAVKKYLPQGCGNGRSRGG